MADPATGSLFVAGAGTEIGKTYATAALTRFLTARGRSVRALKPLASGVPALDDSRFGESDTGRLLAAQGLPVTPETVAACSPWRFRAPLSPDQAAALEGASLALDDLVVWCRARIAERPPEAALLIEGVGGLMSPVTANATGLDWVERLRLPVLLVSGSYLGAISHALTACETLRAHAVPLVAVAVSASPDAPTPPETVAATIARHAGARVGVIGRDAPWPEALADVI